MIDLSRLGTVLRHSVFITCRVKETRWHNNHSSLIFGVFPIDESKKLGFSFNVSPSLCHLSRTQGVSHWGHIDSCRWQFLTEQYCPSHCSMFRLSQILHSKSKSPSVFVKIQKLHFWFVSLIGRKYSNNHLLKDVCKLLHEVLTPRGDCSSS